MLKAGDMPEGLGFPYPRNFPLPSKQQHHDKEHGAYLAQSGRNTGGSQIYRAAQGTMNPKHPKP